MYNSYTLTLLDILNVQKSLDKNKSVVDEHKFTCWLDDFVLL